MAMATAMEMEVEMERGGGAGGGIGGAAGFPSSSGSIDGSGSGGGAAQWAEMLPEALSRIFAVLPLEERLGSVPMVCKAWRRAAMDPACWRAVDLHEWSRLMPWEVIHKMVQLVVERSGGRLEELSVCRLASDEPVDYIAQRGHGLKVLRIPFCQVTDECIANIAPSLRFITHLDISGCTSISKAALVQIGRSCKSLARLDRNMSFFFQTSNLVSEEFDDEALAIAADMPQLRHLELCYGSLTNSGLLAVLDNCKSLEFLDLRGCMNVKIEGSIAERCRKLRVIYNIRFNDQFQMLDLDDTMYDDDMSDVHDYAISDDGWEEWYSSSDEMDPIDMPCTYW